MKPWKCPHCERQLYDRAQQEHAEKWGCYRCPRPDAHVTAYRAHRLQTVRAEYRAEHPHERLLTAHEAQDLEDWCRENKGIEHMHPSDLHLEIVGAPAHLKPSLGRAYSGYLWHKSLWYAEEGK